ncbi:MAG: SDR family oxidoreductase [Planctomycetota bacterium]
MTRKLLIVGCGYLGKRIAQIAIEDGWTVIATTRSQPKRVAELGAKPHILDWNDPRTMVDLPLVDAVVIAVAYDRRSHVPRYESQVGGLRRFIQALDSTHPVPPPISYISTTGVYHQTDGVWVDESSPTRPSREGGRAHLQAESALRKLRDPSNHVTLRLAGIYGPGRVPRAADVIAGRPIASPPDGFLNLIHVHDAAMVTLASLDASRRKQPLYVVADDQPVVRRNFYLEIAKQTRSPSPTFVEPSKDAGVRFRSESNKRIWNRAMKCDLRPLLTYPTYAEGLANILPQL